jgi:hypothetical protein
MITQIYHNIISYLDSVIYYIYQIIIPIRFLFWASGGIIYTLYEYSLALIMRIPTILICMIEGVDNKFWDRCTNSRNGAIMIFMYKWLTLLLFPLRVISYIPARIFFWMFENLYLIPCPILRMESLMDPISHKNALNCNYKDLFDNIHIIPTPCEITIPLKNICWYFIHPIEFVKELCPAILTWG